LDNELNDIWDERSSFYGDLHRVMDDCIGVYHGSLPPEYDDFFHENMHVHIVNSIRLAWDDLANMSGKEFPIYVEPDNDTNKAKQRAEKLENIGYWFNAAGARCGGIDMKRLMSVYMWWLIGAGEAVPMVLPDYEKHTPYFTFRDPRTHYPPVGWTPYTQAAPDDTLFAYEISVGELKRRYPDKRDELDRKLAKTRSKTGTITTGDASTVYMGEYYSADTWMCQTLGGDEFVTLARSDDGDKGHPGVMPVVPMALYSPGSPKGRSIFADQISIQAMMARLFSQKLDYADATLYPMIFTTPLSDANVKVGAWAINEWDPTVGGVQPRVEVIAPRNAIDFDQTMSFVVGLQRMLNRNPEQFQGAGAADSAKALDALKSGVNTTIREMFWPPATSALPKLYEKAAKMDVALWGNELKSAKGKRHNSTFNTSYRPNVDLRDREESFAVEPGLGLAGYQGMLQLLQLYGAGVIDLDTVLEQGEWGRDPQEMKRGIQSDNIEKLMWADLQAKAAQGMLKPDALAALDKGTHEGEDLFEVLARLQQTDQLLMPPPQPMGLPGAGGPGGPGGPPPDLAAGAPPLALLQGGGA
jgi:hypothetical protein